MKKLFSILLLVFFCLNTHAANYYWVGGSGNWSDHTNHWATTSGGMVFHIQVPSPLDNVFFDANSFTSASDVVTVDTTVIYCNNMDWTGATGAPLFRTLPPATSYLIHIYGSLTLASNVSWNCNAITYFESTAPGNTIKTSGVTLNGAFSKQVLNGIGGSWTLLDSLYTSEIDINPGAVLYTNNKTVDCNIPGSSGHVFQNNGWAHLGTSTIRAANYYSGTTVDADSSIIYARNFQGNDSAAYNILNTGPGAFSASCSVNFCTFHLINATASSFSFYGSANDVDMLIGDSYSTIANGFSTSINHFGRAEFTSDVNILDTTYFDTVLFLNPGKLITIKNGKAIMVNDSISLNGTCSAYTNVHSTSSGMTAYIRKSGTPVLTDYLILKDIHASGTGFTSANSIDNGNNSGWSITTSAPRTLYWVGNTNSWSNPMAWALSSGGPGGNCPPTQFDDVFFDAGSFSSSSAIVTIDSSVIYCRNMDWTGATGSPTFKTASLISGAYSIYIYGSLTLTPNLTWNCNGTTYFESTSPGNTVQTNGVALNGNYSKQIFNGSGGTWDLLDSLYTVEVDISPGAVLHTNDHTVDCTIPAGAGHIFQNDGRTYLGTSTIRTYNYNSNSNVDADSSIIFAHNFNGNDSVAYNILHMGPGAFGAYFTANRCTFNFIDASSTSFTFSGSANDVDLLVSDAYSTIDNGFSSSQNHFARAEFTNDVNINDTVYFDTVLFLNPGKQITIKSGKTIMIADSVNLNGVCSAYTNVQSGTAGMPAYIRKTGTPVLSDYLILKDIHAAGTLFTANSTIDNGGNAGWSITTAPGRDLYWVGNTNNWSNPLAWSLTSGGPGGNCPPTQFDNVFFDANSFSSSSDVVTIDSLMIYCNNMNWTGATGNPLFQTATSSTGVFSIRVYGSMTLMTNLSWNCNAITYFESTSPGNTVNTRGVVLNGTFSKQIFNGNGGSWDLLDSLHTENVNVNPGAVLRTNNYTVDCTLPSSAGNNFQNDGRTYLGTSVIRTVNYTSNSNIDADSSIIYAHNFNGNDSVAYNILNTGTGAFSASCTADLCTFNRINAFASSFSFYGSDNDVDLLIADSYTTIANGFSTNQNHFSRADFSNDVNINDTTYFDTVFFNNPGKTITIKSGKTMLVSTDMQVNSSGAFPVTIKSSVSGSNAFIDKPADTVCLNFIYLKNITGDGGAYFYAGDYSFDLGGNINWSFTSCSQPISNVWPGDANYDLTADNADILNIGLAYGETGFTRPGATTTWNPEPCLDWTTQFITGINTKHADTDGNGLVDANDTLAVSLNYGFTHPPFAPASDPRSAYPLYVDIVPVTYYTGNNVTVPIKLGTSAIPANNVYGIAFSITYDQALIEPGTMYVDYAGSWLTGPGNRVSLEKNFYPAGQMDIGVSRDDHLNASGYGTIANLHFKVSTTNTGTLAIGITDVTGNDNTGLAITTVNSSDSVSITTGIDELEQTITAMYPNPCTNQLYFDCGKTPAKGSMIRILSLEGELVNEFPSDNSQRQMIDTEGLAAGTYFLELMNGEQKVTRKFTVMR
ncbi:MAG: T9SS type A sorting domain-containing protein [Bacteroidia bacterium]